MTERKLEELSNNERKEIIKDIMRKMSELSIKNRRPLYEREIVHVIMNTPFKSEVKGIVNWIREGQELYLKEGLSQRDMYKIKEFVHSKDL